MTTRNMAASYLALAITVSVTACMPPLKLTPSDAGRVLSSQTLRAPDPGLKGPYGVLTLYYGNGTDKNRLEFRDSISLITDVVDASKLVNLGSS
ncbi:MAG: hypothetical protein VX291_05085, partial [Gemmatimonadota bacterium]|nr:hypothetical protein [Gemmatimonadota bacterium]